jgi:hypothetical protein
LWKEFLNDEVRKAMNIQTIGFSQLADLAFSSIFPQYLHLTPMCIITPVPQGLYLLEWKYVDRRKGNQLLSTAFWKKYVLSFIAAKRVF